MSGILVVGSMAFDSIETPFGKARSILGGSANYFSLSASYFSPVKCVSTVGEDFPQEHLSALQKRGIDTAGVEIQKGKTFHWSGSYSYELNEATTLQTELNVFESFTPKIPPHFTECPFVFLGNIMPALQISVLSKMKAARIVALDTMNYWIKGFKKELIQAISRAHVLIINEGEIRQLTECHNLVVAAQKVKEMGPETIIVKRGEYGSVLFHKEEIFCAPGLPLAEVKDPTGAGDTFAGGVLGYIASKNPLQPPDFSLWKKAVLYGNTMASFTVQDFGIEGLLHLSKNKIEDRLTRIMGLTQC